MQKNPISALSNIYEHLEIPSFEAAIPNLNTYIEQQKGYQKNSYQVSQQKLDKILTEWDFAFQHWNYQVPESIDIVIDKQSTKNSPITP